MAGAALGAETPSEGAVHRLLPVGPASRLRSEVPGSPGQPRRAPATAADHSSARAPRSGQQDTPEQQISLPGAGPEP